MIVRNEAHIIAQAIESVKPIVSEIIVVDTGSDDGTQEIVRSLGGTVIQANWGDDFAAARNVSLQAASGDWILVLDADEAVAESQLALITELTTRPPAAFSFVQRHYNDDCRLSGFMAKTGEYPEWERTYQGYFESALVRLFPNHLGIQYVGKIHELVEPWIQMHGTVVIEPTAVRLHHYGHTPEILERKTKNKLYKALGAQKAEQCPSDWKAFFELGVECNRPGQREQSIEAFVRSLELKDDYLPTWVNLGYVLCEVGRLDKAIECLSTALLLDPRSEEAHCNIAVAYLRLARLKDAEKHLRAALSISPMYINAWLNLAVVLGNQGRFNEAILACHRVLDLQPDNRQAIQAIEATYALAQRSTLHRPKKQLSATAQASQTPDMATAFSTPVTLQALADSFQATDDAVAALTQLLDDDVADSTPCYRVNLPHVDY
jgi:glycosyltransferase involved in cell wall biosynthesis